MADIWARNEIDSPCVKICVIHPASGLCMGCLRSIDEISDWGKMASGQRRALIAALPARATQIRGQRHGGRKCRE